MGYRADKVMVEGGKRTKCKKTNHDTKRAEQVINVIIILHN